MWVTCGHSISDNCYYLLFLNLAQNPEKKILLAGGIYQLHLAVLFNHTGAADICPQLPAVSFCYTRCSIRKFLCRFLQRGSQHLGCESLLELSERNDFLPFMPRRTHCSLKQQGRILANFQTLIN